MADRVVGEREERLREALRVAADDLGKAANQFEGMRQSQQAGYGVTIDRNPEKFAEKEARARAALASSPSPPDRSAEYELRAIAGDLRSVAASQKKQGFPTSAKFSDERAERLEAVRLALFGRGDES